MYKIIKILYFKEPILYTVQLLCASRFHGVHCAIHARVVAPITLEDCVFIMQQAANYVRISAGW